MPKVTFMPDNITVEVAQGENLLRAAMMADVRVTASCGGDGTCGKCRVIVPRGSVDAKPSARITEEQAVEGYVLACQATVLGDVSVTVPAQSRPGGAVVGRSTGRTPNPVLSADEQAARIPSKRSNLAMAKRRITVTEPTHADNASDLTRIKQALAREHHMKDVDVTLDAIRQLPEALRDGDWTVTAIVRDDCDGISHVTGFQPGDTTARQFGLAVDVGTTTVEVSLVDLVSRSAIAQAAEYNAQVDLGEDVITRIIAASKPGGLEELQSRVVRTISALARKVLTHADIDESDLLLYVVAGNTVMTHLLLGISPVAIRTAPYVPATAWFPWVRAHTELGLPGTNATRLAAVGCPASWLGGDIVSGVVAAGLPWSDKLTLFIDIGTNGEIVLGGKDFLVACSCSAGPAFEGGGITHGMRAADGAIEQVRVDPETFEPMVLTIGNTKPLGICGSGLIDCVSELFLSGAIDRTGKFDTAAGSPYIRAGERGAEYVLVAAEQSGTGSDITLTEPDIENLMRAKAAIFAGINVLVESLDLTLDAIDEIVVAGGFGHYLDLERVMALGMFPELPAERFVFFGNSSLSGARLAVASKRLLEKTAKVSEAMTYLELSVNAGFMESYLSSLFLPHTDLSLFPKTEALLSERVSWKAVS